jgi:beta-xylosidase
MRVTNPLMQLDLPDPDILRVGDTYYMVSTTMFVMPGGPVLRSRDLVHWELVSYIFDTVEENAAYRLEDGKNAYGRGQWATSLTWYQGEFFACFVCHDTGKTYLYHTPDIEQSNWDRYEIGEVFHDMSFLLDGGHNYLVYGNGEIGIVELNAALSGLKKGGVRRRLIDTPKDGLRLRCEGCRAYKLGGYYYFLLIDWPQGGGRRREICYRAKSLDGPFERRILTDDDLGVRNQGVAQGCLIDTPQGDWYAMLFQDHGAVGRIPVLMPVRWQDGWPVLMQNGKIPLSFEMPLPPYSAQPLVKSDSFCHADGLLDPVWQWNHNPVPGAWSFTEHPGFLRLHCCTVTDHLLCARNTLTQKTFGPRSSFAVEVFGQEMAAGGYAGLAAFEGQYGMIGLAREADGTSWLMLSRGKAGAVQTDERLARLKTPHVFLRADFNYEDQRDEVQFLWRTEDGQWQKAGPAQRLFYTLDLFIGCRAALFHYGRQTAQGSADFRDFSVGTQLFGGPAESRA